MKLAFCVLLLAGIPAIANAQTSDCATLRAACMNKQSLGETGQGNCRTYRAMCTGQGYRGNYGTYGGTYGNYGGYSGYGGYGYHYGNPYYQGWRGWPWR